MNPLKQKIKIRANNFNISHLNSLGYFPKLNEYIEILAQELPHGSGTKINVQCNYCKEIFKKSYRRFMETKEDVCCEKCKKYKIMKKSLKKYGNICSLRNENVLNKAKAKNRKTLGVDYPFQSKEVLEKCRNTLVKNSKRTNYIGKTSKHQKAIHAIYGGIINYSCFPYFLDIFFEKEKIYFEYDGGGHSLSVKFNQLSEEEFVLKEAKRESFLESLQYKQFRIINSNKKLPESSFLLHIKERAFFFLMNKGCRKYIYNLDTKTESFE